MTEIAARSPSVIAARLYLVLLPAGHLVYAPVEGAWGNGADVVLLLLLLVTAAEWLFSARRRAALLHVLRGRDAAGMPSRGFLAGVALLALFGAWVALSGLWGFHPGYAAAKGSALGALALGAAAIATSGIGWRRAADAWLQGTALALLLTVVLGAVGSPGLRERIFFVQGGGVLGLPFPRMAGPLYHPNLMGDYLVVSGLLLWGRWRELTGPAKSGAAVLAALVGLALLLTASTAWVAAGVVMVLLGGRAARGAAPLRVAGAVLALVTFLALVVPLDVSIAGVGVTTNGIRPPIWWGSLEAVLEAPLLGVGAAPYLAAVVDPVASGAGPVLWDAHNAYLSVLGQFGALGFALLGGGAWMVVRAARASGASRSAVSVRLALVAIAVHAVFLASEDARHVWAVVGLVGLVGQVEAASLE